MSWLVCHRHRLSGSVPHPEHSRGPVLCVSPYPQRSPEYAFLLQEDFKSNWPGFRG
jgi:hypothetical protein